MEKWVKIDVNKKSSSLADILNYFTSNIIGQDHAIKRLVDSFAKIHSKLSSDVDQPKPLGVFLLLGQTGVGKTYFAKLLAKILNGSMSNMTKINGSEFQESHSISKLIGSPPGYVGFYDKRRQDGQQGMPPVLSQENIEKNCGKKIIDKETQLALEELSARCEKKSKPLEEHLKWIKTEKEKLKNSLESEITKNPKLEVLNKDEHDTQTKILIIWQKSADEAEEIMDKVKPYPVILFDEIEKAHPALHQMLLQIIDEGQLQMSNGEITSFNNAFILLTGNVGAREINDILKGKIGFREEKNQEDKTEEVIKTVNSELKKHFLPELIGRLRKENAIVVFNTLNEEALLKILDLELAKIQKRLNDISSNITFQCTEEAKKYLLRVSNTAEFGARELNGTAEHRILEPLAYAICSKEVESGDEIRITANEEGLIFEKKEKEKKDPDGPKPNFLIKPFLKRDQK